MEAKKILLNEPVASTDLEIEVLGCFSLPETWKPAENETQEYSYNISFLSIQVNNGRIRRRELTEEEIKAAEEAKKGKKEPPKKKGVEAEVDIQEALKKNEEHTRRGSQSSRYDDEAIFHQNREDLFKNPCVAWETSDVSGDSRLVKTFSVSATLDEMKMVEFLEHLEDTGCYLDLARIPKAVEEEAKKKPVKGKVQEEAKSSFYKAWVDLSAFRDLGVTEQQMRIKLEDIEGEEAINSKTYLFLKLRLSHAVFPPITGHITQATDLIPIKPPPPKFLPSKDGTHDFQRQVKLACKAISAEFHNNYSDQLSTPSSLKSKEKRDIRKDEFLYYFNTSGKSQILKNKLRKSVVKICRERFKTITTLKGLTFSSKDKYYSEIYAYLLEKMQESIDEVTKEKREVLHEEPVLPSDLAEKEKQEKLGHVLCENFDDKLKRLAEEAEIRGEVQKAMKNLIERTDRNPMDKQVWLDLAQFTMRQCNLQGAEKYMSEVVSLSEDWTREEHLLMSCILITRKKYSEALVFLYRILEHNPDDSLTLLTVVITYRMLNKSSLEKFFLSKLKRLCQVHLNLAGSKSRIVEDLLYLNIRPEDFKSVGTEIIDELHLVLAEYLLGFRLPELSRLVLSFMTSKDYKADKVLYCSAEIEFWSKQYEKSVGLLEEVLKLDGRRHSAWALKADALFYLRRLPEAQECYLKAMRYSKAATGTMLVRLGNIYLTNSAWAGAKLLFTRCCHESPSSIAWEGLGIACLNLEELDYAEKALTQANLMNDENAYVLANLAYVCIKKTTEPPGRYPQFRQCLVQALRLGLKEPRILTKIGHEYVRKFFLAGTGPASSKLDVSELKVIYQKARQGDATRLKEEIEKEFENLKKQGNNKLDTVLIASIDRAKQEVLSSLV
jgi:tetratricopeptide (TPR) repeat protein